MTSPDSNPEAATEADCCVRIWIFGAAGFSSAGGLACKNQTHNDFAVQSDALRSTRGG